MTKIHSSRLTAITLIWLLWDVKEPTPLFEKSRGRRPGGGGYSYTLPIWVCATQRGRHFEAPDLERGIHFRGAF